MTLTLTQKRVLAFLKRQSNESLSITDNCGTYRIGRTKVPVVTLKALVHKGFVSYERVTADEHIYSIKETA